MKKRRSLSALVVLALTLALIPTAWAAAPSPAVSTNLGAHEYVNGRRWAQPITSYLYENPSGGLTRVEYMNGQVVVEDYDQSFGIQSSRTIQGELPVWGGFFAGENYNFLVFGQNNQEENDSKEVIRIVKFDKNWNRLGQASLRGANTIEPFEAGVVRCDEYGGYLYIHTSHKMYTAQDGLNHQASVMLALRQEDMEITDSAYEVGGPSYVSHSFNQFILIDREQNIVTLDHGDAYPRSAVLQKLIAKAGQDSFRQEKRVPAEKPGWYYTVYEDEIDVQTFPQAAQHYNDTGCALGGFAETSKGYVTAYQFDGTASNLGSDSRSMYLAFTDKQLSGSSSVQLTTGENVSNPQLASTGLGGGYVLWNTVEQKNWYTTRFGDTLYYASYDAAGAVGQIQTAKGSLSDCQPIYYNGKVVWYATDGSAPVFYQLDSSGVTTVSAGETKPEPPIDPCAGGHTWREETTPATCVKDGQTIRTCTVCGEKETTVLPKTAHTWQEQTTPATCVKDGQTTRTCTVCGEKEVTTLSKTAHTWEQKTEPATETETGRIYQVCSVCGAEETLSILPAKPADPVQPTVTFTDVKQGDWFRNAVEKAASAGLVNGMGDGIYDPYGKLTVAQALVLAYQLDSASGGALQTQSGEAWYMPYYRYCLTHDIVTASQVKQSDLTRYATRFEMVSILDQAVPRSRLEPVKTVTSIPDLAESDRYGDLVFKWYRAGILSGDEKGRFNGGSDITRAEMAVILCQINNLL